MGDAASRRALAERDIEGVLRQLTDGELDAETADRLIRGYREEIERLDLGEEQAGTDNRQEVEKASRSRRLIGTLTLVVMFAGVAITALYAVRSRDGGFITGDIGGPVDLAEVTNEQMEAVIAANPDIPQIAAMRLSLADRYFDEGKFSTALPHYLGALDGALDAARRARGLARVGWMSYLSGSPDIAEAYLVEALEIDPGYLEARLFHGLLLFDRGDGAGALTQLEPLLLEEDLPANTRKVIEETVEAARASIEGERWARAGRETSG